MDRDAMNLRALGPGRLTNKVFPDGSDRSGHQGALTDPAMRKDEPGFIPPAYRHGTMGDEGTRSDGTMLGLAQTATTPSQSEAASFSAHTATGTDAKASLAEAAYHGVQQALGSGSSSSLQSSQPPPQRHPSRRKTSQPQAGYDYLLRPKSPTDQRRLRAPGPPVDTPMEFRKNPGAIPTEIFGMSDDQSVQNSVITMDWALQEQSEQLKSSSRRSRRAFEQPAATLGLLQEAEGGADDGGDDNSFEKLLTPVPATTPAVPTATTTTAKNKVIPKQKKDKKKTSNSQNKRKEMMAVAAAAKAVKVPGSSLEDDEDFGQKMAFRPRGFPSDIPLTVGGATKQTPEKNAMVAAAVGAATYPEMDKPMSPSIPPDSFDFSVDDTPVPYLKDPPAAGMPNNLARMSREASASRFRGSPVLNSSSGSSSASDMDNGENVRTPNTKIAAFEDSKPAYKPRPSPQLDDEEVHQRGRRPRNMSRGRGRSGSVPRESDMSNQRGNNALSGTRQNGLESSIRHMSVAEDDPILTGRRGSNDHRADMYSSVEEDKSEPHGMASSTSPTGVASFDEQNPGHAKEGKDTDGVTMDPPLSSFPVVSAASEQARDSNHVAQEATAVENEDDDIDLGINLDGMLSLSSKGTKDKNTDKNKKDKADKKKKDKNKKPKKGLAKLSDERDETLLHSRNKTPASPNKAESTPRRRKRGASVSSEKSTRGPVAGIRKGISRRLGLKKKDNEKKDPSSDDDRTETNAGNDEPEEEEQQQ